MNVLAEQYEYCGSHTAEDHSAEAQLVVFDPCVECDPTQSNFFGTETGEEVMHAVVMDRPDLDREGYIALLRPALERRMGMNEDDQSRLLAIAIHVADEQLGIARHYEPGATVVRTFGAYDITYRHKKAA